MRRRTCLFLFLWGLLSPVLIAFVPVNQARADMQFSSPQTLSDIEASASDIVVDSKDRATVVWQGISSDHDFLLIQAVRLDAEGAPGPIRTLSSVPNFGSPEGCPCPRAVVDPQDRVTVAWQTYDGADLRIEAARLGADGIPGAVQTLSGAGRDAGSHEIAVDHAGEVTIVWRVAGSPQAVELARIQADGAIVPPQPLSEAEANARSPDIAVDRAGRVVVVWRSDEGIQATRVLAGEVVDPPQTLSPIGEDAGIPRVVVDSKDRATVAWWRGAGVYEVKVVRLDSDGTSGPIHKLSPDGQSALGPQLAVDSLDRVTAAWEDFDQQVNAVRIGADGTPGLAHRLSSEGHVAGTPRVAAGPNEAVVVWAHSPPVFIPPFSECLDHEFNSASDRVRAAVFDADGNPGPPLGVSAPGQQSIEPLVAVDSDGRPTVVWTSFDGTYFCPDLLTRVQVSRGSDLLGEVETPASPGPPAVSPPVFARPPTGDTTLRVARRALVRGGRLAIRAVCIAERGAVCEGVIGLLAPRRFGRAPSWPTGEKRRALVAKGCYRLFAGRRGILRLRLSRFALRAVKRGDAPRRIRATAMGRGVEARPVALLPRRSGRRLRRPQIGMTALFESRQVSGGPHRPACRP